MRLAEWLKQADTNKRYTHYRKKALSKADIVNMHILPVTCEGLGTPTPASATSLCQKVSLADLTPVNNICYDEQGMRECARTHGRKMCGQCVATLYADRL